MHAGYDTKPTVQLSHRRPVYCRLHEHSQFGNVPVTAVPLPPQLTSGSLQSSTQFGYPEYPDAHSAHVGPPNPVAQLQTQLPGVPLTNTVDASAHTFARIVQSSTQRGYCA